MLVAAFLTDNNYFMPIDYKNYPANWKTEIRPAIMQRAENRCEFCGVKHYAVGYWDKENFIPTSGNIEHDAAGQGLLTYKQARELVNHSNGYCDDKLIVIVLTIAHLEKKKKNNDYSNLKALCQRCHNRYDVKFRKQNRRNSRVEKLGLQTLFV